eukprot:TRINITY_DN23400_c0_g1_i1.p2 TRINITY_DN23400_c0_g1~~TRINITY_DN23400_c0_g1_i1.p2  ORF type:complete len:204 (+),score=4.76 TRINITY_DN23400_c0_g1_i1:152-763(+)
MPLLVPFRIGRNLGYFAMQRLQTAGSVRTFKRFKHGAKDDRTKSSEESAEKSGSINRWTLLGGTIGVTSLVALFWVNIGSDMVREHRTSSRPLVKQAFKIIREDKQVQAWLGNNLKLPSQLPEPKEYYRKTDHERITRVKVQLFGAGGRTVFATIEATPADSMWGGWKLDTLFVEEPKSGKKLFLVGTEPQKPVPTITLAYVR